MYAVGDGAEGLGFLPEHNEIMWVPITTFCEHEFLNMNFKHNYNNIFRMCGSHCKAFQYHIYRFMENNGNIRVFKNVLVYYFCLKGRVLVLDFNEHIIIKSVCHRFRGNRILDKQAARPLYGIICQNYLCFSEEEEKD